MSAFQRPLEERDQPDAIRSDSRVPFILICVECVTVVTPV